MASSTVARAQMKCKLCPQHDDVNLSDAGISSKQMGQSGREASACSGRWPLSSCKVAAVIPRCMGCALDGKLAGTSAHLRGGVEAQVKTDHFRSTCWE